MFVIGSVMAKKEAFLH